MRDSNIVRFFHFKSEYAESNKTTPLPVINGAGVWVKLYKKKVKCLYKPSQCKGATLGASKET
ncbi:hypothetical protein AT243_04060 [Bartonella henselae]|nr:hypothetical protein AT243_04060 [Bartonella henselae]